MKRGFTLIELLAVLFIIGVFAGICGVVFNGCHNKEVHHEGTVEGE